MNGVQLDLMRTIDELPDKGHFINDDVLTNILR